MSKPVLTIGMIVKNEIRCLGKCLKALQPLRDAVSCELIIADTGSDDGTREVAEKYADIVFDFPWINDFSAARNSVIDRASGEWYLTVDADEYLDADCTELINFLSNPYRWTSLFCGVIIRNYGSLDLTGSYTDFMAVRMVRMQHGIRYQGAIHESWTNAENVRILGQRKTIFHHDGYVGLGAAEGAEKRKRNMDLLKEELKKSPGELKILMQCIDSSIGTEDCLTYIRNAIQGIREKRPGWETMGPVIFRSAVNTASGSRLPECWDWVHEAEELFPDSLYIKISINRTVLIRCFQEKDYPEVVRRGEIYLRAMEDYLAGNFNAKELCISALDADPIQESYVRILLADACFKEKEYERASDVLLPVDGGYLDAGQTSNYMSTLLNLHAQTHLDMSAYMVRFWQQINAETPRKHWANLRRNAVFQQAQRAYSVAFRKEEEQCGNRRHAYTLFLPLKGTCELGTAAAILEAVTIEEAEGLLSTVKEWNQFPIGALAHAIEYGVDFPVSDKALELEKLDDLADRLSDCDEFRDIVERTGKTEFSGDWRKINWMRALLLASIRTNWSKMDEQRGMELSRLFACVEQHFISICFAPQIICEENLHLMPPLHRFGWYCIQAFDALDAGDTVGYAHFLRKGLISSPTMKNMVEFLLDHTPELQLKESDSIGELLTLAHAVRDMLLALPADDPAIEAIRQSLAYQKVAHLIEGSEQGIYKGVAQ